MNYWMMREGTKSVAYHRNNMKQLNRRDALKLAGFTSLAFSLEAILSGCGGGKTYKLPASARLLSTAGGQKVSQPGWTVRVDPDIQPSKEWTVLVYMNGANDLETYGLLNTNQLEQSGSTEDINFVVQYKRFAGRYDSTDGDWGDTRRFYIDRATDPTQIESTLISQHNGVDMGDKARLSEFIQWGVTTFPARRYCLVLWNHGAGWRSVKSVKKVTRGLSYDDVTGNHIDTIDIPGAMSHPSGRMWDLLVVDCSLMQMAEVVYELRNKAEYIVGSQESPPGEGLPYDAFARSLVRTPTVQTKDLAIDLVNQTISKYGSLSNTTQSVIDTSQVALLSQYLDNLGVALLAASKTYGTAISDSRALAESYAYSENKDLLDFIDLLTDKDAQGNFYIPDPDVQAAAVALRTAVKAVIVKNVNGSQHPRSQGLAIFLPTPIRFKTIDIEQANGFGQRYKELALAKAAPNWLAFLENGPR
jgi:hypothetical protein